MGIPIVDRDRERHHHVKPAEPIGDGRWLWSLVVQHIPPTHNEVSNAIHSYFIDKNFILGLEYRDS